MSSGLFKSVEGAVFPFQVESLEDGEDDAVPTGYVDEADHRPGMASYFHEAAFDDMGGAPLPQVSGGARTTAVSAGRVQAPHHGPSPATSAPEAAEGGLRLGPAAGLVNGLRARPPRRALL
jgi:hypothetical protein